jgi:hypothetical protein
VYIHAFSDVSIYASLFQIGDDFCSVDSKRPWRLFVLAVNKTAANAAKTPVTMAYMNG